MPRTCSSWYAAHAFPASVYNFATVLMLTPEIRVMARMLVPSTSIERICARFVVDSLFMGRIVAHLTQ